MSDCHNHSQGKAHNIGNHPYISSFDLDVVEREERVKIEREIKRERERERKRG